MRSLALLTLLFATSTSDANAHCYSIWRYKQPQNCEARTVAHSWRVTAFVRLPAAERPLPPERPCASFCAPPLSEVEPRTAADDAFLRSPYVQKLILINIGEKQK